jgi:hypothetical protein
MNEQTKGRESKYAKKVKEGKQMYGPGCCAHKLTPERMRSIRIANGTLYREKL